ncbi:hypothetical protein GYMLUDRAFT_46144 [Collybiopsis luxurians FD-317 M1]|uniref:RING-CH-type domain-containing protein n=1 Tax=Collybiopsis luxurians FD-317 M1 TaxID=944289 RepID=A0A0D0C567_9AGAR|nr:hypothetical protein GYMLUDRAFT_46144 [Collybiopsis luxurians FD-317 M1]
MSDYVPTIDDIRVKMCYICREEETFDSPSDPPSSWTHPCRCTLIAHESCLLSWIETAQAKPTTSGHRDALKCPQCGTRYEIVHTGGLWGYIERGVWRVLTEINVAVGYLGKVVLIMVPSTVVSVVGAGTYWILTKYGAYAVREFFGKQVYDTFLSSDMSIWPWTAYINLPLIPIFLIASRFDSTGYGYLPVVSALLEWPNLYDPRLLLNMPTTSTSISTTLYPPSPYTVGFILLPLARYLYSKALAKVTQWVLGPRIPTVNGEDENALMVVRVRGGAAAAGPNPDNANADGNNANPEPAVEPADDGDQEQTITIYASPLGRKLAGALLVPLVARYMGNFLLRLASRQSVLARYLRRLLAIGPQSKPSPNLSWWNKATLGEEYPNPTWSSASKSSESILGSPSPLSFGFGVGSLKWQIDGNKRGNVSWKDVLRVLWGGSKAWADFDPVWWRNTIGFGLFVVAKDALNLLHLYLIKRERESRKIKNRDFSGVELGGLELIPRP